MISIQWWLVPACWMSGSVFGLYLGVVVFERPRRS